MKKIICTVLCIIMLLSLVPTSIFAAQKGETTYTMWGNNILQAFIQENNYNESDPYKIKPTERYEGLIAALQHYSPDIVALQECDLGWHNLIDDFEDYATTNGIKTFEDIGYVSVLDTSKWEVEGVRTPLYIKAGKFNVIDSGVVKYGGSSVYYEDPFVFCWAVLEDKASGDKFAVSSTHIGSGAYDDSAKAAQIKELVAFMKNIEKTHKAPLVMMGDYNVSPDPGHYPKAYSEFKLGELLLTSREVAKEVVGSNYRTTNKRTQKPEATNELASGVIDHAMISTVGIAPIKYETMVEVFDSSKNLATYSYSDHVPQRLTFKVVGTDHKHSYDIAEQYDDTAHKVYCKECYLAAFEDHNFGGGYVPTKDSDTTHERQCTECGYGDKSEHIVPVGEKLDNDTHRGECELCGAVGVGAHVYSWTKVDSDNCSGACSCGATTTRKHVYEYTSNGDGEHDTHTGRCACGNDFDESHAWDEGKITKKATYETSGTRLFTCTLCGEERSEKIESFDIPDSAYELTEGGQQHLYAGNAVTTAPKIDGKIEKGEYTLSFTGMSTKTDEEDDNFFHDDPTKNTDVSDVELHVAYDDDSFYFAVKSKDSSYNAYEDAATFYIGAKENTNELYMYYMPRITAATPEVYPWGYQFDDSSRVPPQAEALWSQYVSQHKTIDENGVVTYEIAVKRGMLENGDKDKIFFAFRLTSGGNETMYFGFDTRGLAGIYDKYRTPYQAVDMYPHVLMLEAEPETEPVETESLDTAPVESVPTETTPVETEPKADAKGGCGSSIAVAGIALVSMLSLCVAFVTKKR